MLSVLFIWLDILITTLPAGGFFLFVSVRKKDRSFLVLEDYLICGLMAVTVYAQYFSIFYKVGLLAHIILYILDLIIVIFFLKSGSFSEIKSYFSEKKIGTVLPQLVFSVFLFVFMCYGTSRGYMHFDSDLYHAQSIRWIEEYGLVKGLGNIHGRLAYNSSSFALSALYSFAFLGGRSYHACAGFLALVLSHNCFRVFHLFFDKKVKPSDLARIGALYYVFNIYDEMVSPASDYFAMMFFLYIVVRLMDVSESEVPVSVFTVLSVFLVTIKFSAFGLAFICVYPIVIYIKKKEYSRIILYIFLSLLVSAPFFIRNYLISGWLLYPSTFPDFFDPVWKIPQIFAESDKAYIVAYGRGYTNMDASSYPFSVWFPHWFTGLALTEKVFIIACLFSFLIFGIFLFLVRGKHVLKLTLGCVFLSFLLWLFSSPLTRYGQGIYLVLPFAVFGAFVSYLTDSESIPPVLNKLLNVSVIAFVSLFLVYKGAGLCSYFSQTYYKDSYVYQLDYGSYDMYPYTVDGLTFYTPEGMGRAGYDPFPSTPQEDHTFYALGNDYSDGFASKLSEP